ncbi:ABC transporter substrate-binding protein [Gorillibacterium sp. sgz5001074]|uniref:ABC transporter substrate-binding protein n=1 Tax=Gorillibacterium sp. sgz5001074 TaxID=3446695 RepID=UPI003F681B11
MSMLTTHIASPARKLRTAALTLLTAVSLFAVTACGEKPDATAGASAAATAKATAAPSSAAGTAPAGNTAKPIPEALRVGYIGANPLNLPRGAEGWGFYKGSSAEDLKKLGITEVKFTAFPNGPDLNEALLAGRLDVGILGDTPAIVARSNGSKTRLIGFSNVGMNAYIIGKKNGPKTLADLKGKQIAVQKGSYIHRYLVGVLKKEYLYDSVKIIHLLSADAEAALERGEIDALAAASGAGPQLVAKGFPLIDEASKNPTLTGTSLTVVSEEYLTKNPGFPKVWNDLKGKALNDLLAKQDAYYEFLGQIYKYPPEIIRKDYPIGEIPEQPLPEAALKQLEGTKQFIIDEALAKKDFSLPDWLLK